MTNANMGAFDIGNTYTTNEAVRTLVSGNLFYMRRHTV